jgi:hypothetical protein
MPGAFIPTVHQLKIGLEGAAPPLWRRIQIPSAASLGFLHDVIQVAFGWEGYHLNRFQDGRGREWGEPPVLDRGGFMAAALADEEEASIGEVLRAEGAVLEYVYDFGDSWLHRIEAEKMMPLDPGVRYPRCTGGRRAARRRRTSGGSGGWKRSFTWSRIRRRILPSISKISSATCVRRRMTRARSIPRS